MKKILAPLFALAVLVTGCSTATEEAEPQPKSIASAPAVTEVAIPVTAAADAEWDAPVIVEIPEVVEAPEVAWEAWDNSGATDALVNGGQVSYVQTTPEAHVFEVAGPVVPEFQYVEAVKDPTYVPPMPDFGNPPTPDAQQWVREITGDYTLTVYAHEGAVDCGAVLCEHVFDDGTTVYYIHPLNVGQPGARQAIVDMWANR